MLYGQGRQGFNFTETEIRYAMSNTKSNHAAARFLRITYITYRKYAKQYIDEATGKSLFELHKNISGKGLSKRQPNSGRYQQHMENIFAGSQPKIRTHELRDKLIRHSYKEEKCALCGFEERRIIDYRVPLLVDFIDGNTQNFALDNLQLLCHNCVFLTVRTPRYPNKKFSRL